MTTVVVWSGTGWTYIRVAIVRPLVESLHRLPNAHGRLCAGPALGSHTEVKHHRLLGVLLGVEVADSVTGVRIVSEDLRLRLGVAGGGGDGNL